MLSEQQLIVGYICLAGVTAVVFGVFQKNEPEGAEAVFFWCLSALWPLVWGVVILSGIVSGPFWIGQRIRKVILKRKPEPKP